MNNVIKFELVKVDPQLDCFNNKQVDNLLTYYQEVFSL